MSMSTEMLIDRDLASGISPEQLKKEMEEWYWESEEKHKDAIRYLHEKDTNGGIKLSRRERRALKRKQLKK